MNTARINKIIGVVLCTLGAAYTARAFLLIKVPGELPVSNSFPFIAGVIFCVGTVGIFFSNIECKIKNINLPMIFLTLFFCIAFAVTFESYGALSSSFALCLTLGVIWNKRYKLAEFITGACVSCICVAGIWLVFNRIFSLALP